MKQQALLSIIGTGSGSAKKNEELLAILKARGIECAQGELRGLINNIRLDPQDNRVLCAGQNGYFWASTKAEALAYKAELHRRNQTQLEMERAIEDKIEKQFPLVPIVIDSDFIKSLGFDFIAERTWYNTETGYMIKKSSDTVKYPNIYGLFLRGDKISNLDSRAELLNALQVPGSQLGLF